MKPRMLARTIAMNAPRIDPLRWVPPRGALRAVAASLAFHGAIIALCVAQLPEAPAMAEPVAEVQVNVLELAEEIVISELEAIVPATAEPAAQTSDEAREAVELARTERRPAAELPSVDIPQGDVRNTDATESSVRIEIISADGSPVADAPEQAEISKPAEPVAVAASATVGEGNGYWRDVRGSIARHLRYPRVAAASSVATNILLRITIDAGGKLLEAVAENSAPSPYTLAAQRAVERAAPFAPPGTDVPLQVQLPVRFERF